MKSILLKNVFADDPALKYICGSNAPAQDSDLCCSASTVVLHSSSALDSCSPSRTVSRDILCGIPSFLLTGLSFVAVSLLTNSSSNSFCARVRPMALICALPDAPASRYSDSMVLKSMSFNRLSFLSKSDFLKFHLIRGLLRRHILPN